MRNEDFAGVVFYKASLQFNPKKDDLEFRITCLTHCLNSKNIGKSATLLQ